MMQNKTIYKYGSHLTCQNEQDTEPNQAQSIYFKMLVSISLQTYKRTNATVRMQTAKTAGKRLT